MIGFVNFIKTEVDASVKYFFAFIFYCFLISIYLDNQDLPVNYKEIKTKPITHIQEVLLIDVNGDNLKDIVVVGTNDNEPPERFIKVFLEKSEENKSGTSEEKNNSILIKLNDDECTIFPFKKQNKYEIFVLTLKGISSIYWDGERFTRTKINFVGKDATLKLKNLAFTEGQCEEVSILHFNQVLSEELKSFIIPATNSIFYLFQYDERQNNFKTNFFNLTSYFKTTVIQKKNFSGKRAFQLSLKSIIPNIHTYDINNDKLNDIIILYQNKIYVFLQGKDNSFKTTPNYVYELPYGENELLLSRGSFVKFIDLNNDGKLDLVVQRIIIDPESISKLYTQIDIFLGSGNYKSLFDKHSITVKIDGLSAFPQFCDVNSDGITDIAISTIKISLLSQLVSIGLWNNITMHFFILSGVVDKGKLKYDVAYSKAVDVEPEVLQDNLIKSHPIRFDVDFNHDNVSDMLEIDYHKGLLLYLGKKSSKGLLYSKSPVYTKKLEIPKGIYITDLNNDGKTDIVLTYSSYILVFKIKK